MTSVDAQGYVYVLINQSLPGCVKIGKTTRSGASRAAELSSATGVPTPFLVAYEAFFDNCHDAESRIHALLESEGMRLASNREFFTISAAQAINAIIRIQSDFIGQFSLNSGPASIETEPDFPSPLPWERTFDEAEEYLYGLNNTIQDEDKARELFKVAAKLGSGQAYVKLAESYTEKAGLDWLRRGADAGHPECWLMLAQVFSGETFSFESVPANMDNARKAYCSFFTSVNVESCEDRQVFFAIKKYFSIIDGKPRQSDADALKEFLPKFNKKLLDQKNAGRDSGELDEFTNLLNNYK